MNRLLLDETITIKRQCDGYINATYLCKKAGKEWFDYLANMKTQEFLDSVAGGLNIPVANLYHSKRGGGCEGTWVHPCVATHLAQWLSVDFAVKVSMWIEAAIKSIPQVQEEYQQALTNLEPDHNFQVEREVRSRLATQVAGNECVKGEYGEINIVSDEEVIEVTWAPKFSHALGQVLVHSESFPDKRRRVHLFGSGDDCSPEKMSRVSVVFEKFGVVLTYEIVDGLKTVM